MNLYAGLIASGIVALLQSAGEVLGLAFLYHGYIFRPQDLYKSQIFLLARRILGLGRHSSMPQFLDRYLGPDFVDQLPVFFTITGVYAAVSLVTGICLGFIFWLKLRKKEVSSDEVYRIHLSTALACWLPLNAVIYLLKILERGYSPLQQKLIFLSALVIASGVIWILYKIIQHLLNGWNFPGRKISRIFSVVPVLMLLITFSFMVPKIFGRGGDISGKVEIVPVKGASFERKTPNVILISIDSLRADHLSCYGYGRKTSPAIDSLAGDGFLFKNAFSTTSWTLPAHRSLLTSTYPEENDVYSYMDPLSDNHSTLAEILMRNGYTTAAFVSGPLLASSFGMNQGFVTYDDFTVRFKTAAESHEKITSPLLHTAISNWLKENSRKNFFLFLHYWDVHYDYNPPAPYDTLFDTDYKGNISRQNFIRNKQINKNMNPRDLAHVLSQYDGEIAFTDFYIGQLMQELKRMDLYNDSMIILTADHGDEFFEHGYKGHMRTLYDEVLQVPLILKFPSSAGFSGGKKLENLVSIVDVLPTVLGYLRISTPTHAKGRNLLNEINGGRTNPDYFHYSSLRNEMFALRSMDTKFIQRSNLPRKEFYDLLADPLEKVNLYEKGNTTEIVEADRQLRLLLDLLNLQRRVLRSRPEPLLDSSIEPEDSVKEQLKALGYVQ